jgi:glutaredoxin
MNIAARPGTTGATRTCPHCKATILESSAVCPACRGYLKLDALPVTAAQRFVPLKVEGTINAPDDAAFEYTMVVVIRNERGEEIGRHVAGVGAVFPGESRSFDVSVEAVAASPGKRRLKH